MGQLPLHQWPSSAQAFTRLPQQIEGLRIKSQPPRYGNLVLFILRPTLIIFIFVDKNSVRNSLGKVSDVIVHISFLKF